jgi:hypothetical protein
MGVTSHPLGNASKNHARKSRTAMTADHDEVGSARFAAANDFRVGFSALYENLVELETELRARVLYQGPSRSFHLLNLLGFDDDASLWIDQGQIMDGGQYVTDCQSPPETVGQGSRLA